MPWSVSFLREKRDKQWNNIVFSQLLVAILNHLRQRGFQFDILVLVSPQQFFKQLKFKIDVVNAVLVNKGFGLLRRLDVVTVARAKRGAIECETRDIEL